MEGLKRAGSSLLQRLNSGKVQVKPETKEESDDSERVIVSSDLQIPRNKLSKRQSSFFTRLERRSSWLTGGDPQKDDPEAALCKQALRFSRLQRMIFPEEIEPQPGSDNWERSIINMENAKGLRKQRDRKTIQRVLCGRANIESGDLVEESTVLKIFLICNPSDTEYERDCFHGFVLPYLRKLCRRLGLELQFIDFATGMPVATQTIPEFRNLSLHYLQAALRQKEGTLGFVALSGNKYGNLSLPIAIKEDDYDTLCNHSSDVKATLERFYELDENLVPPQYVMRFSQDFLQIHSLNRLTLAVQELWNNEYACLEEQFLRASAMTDCSDTETLPQKLAPLSIMHEQLNSVFELCQQEPLPAILSFRDFIQNGMTPQDILVNNSFADVGSTGYVQFARNRHTNLKETMKTASERSFAPVLAYSVEPGEKFDPIREENHAAYIRKLMLDWIRCIERILTLRPTYVTSWPFDHVKKHLQVAHTAIRGKLIEREDLMQSLQVALRSCSTAIVRGGPGCGKTTLLCSLMVQQTQAHEDKVVIFRSFKRATSAPNVTVELHALSSQIARAYGHESGKFAAESLTYNSVVNAFWNSLSYASEKRPLLLILDEIEHISCDTAECVNWVPSKDALSPNVALVVSVSDLDSKAGFEPSVIQRNSHILQTLRSKRFSRDVLVPSIPRSQVKEILLKWLRQDKRKLNFDQLESLVNAASKNGDPSILFLKLLYSRARKWRSSYTVPQSWNVIRDIRSFIASEINEIETEHGKEMVQAILSFCTISKQGLSIMELQDLLSLQNSVLMSDKTFDDGMLPTIPRVPQAKIARAIDDLSFIWLGGEDSYLEGHRLTFGNEIFSTILKNEAILSQESLHAAANLLASYFSSHSKSEETTIERINVKLGTNRMSLSQPRSFRDDENQVRVNERRLLEVSNALAYSQRNGELQTLLSDPDHLRHLIRFGGTDFAIKQLRLVKGNTLLSAIASALKLSQYQISRNLAVFEEQLWGRLHGVIGTGHPLVNYLNRNRGQSASSDVLNSRWSNNLEKANGPLLNTLEGSSAPIYSTLALKLSDGRRTLISASSGTLIQMWDLETGRLLRNLVTGSTDDTPIRELKSITLWDARLLVVVPLAENVLVWSADQGMLHARLEGHSLPVTSIATTECIDGSQVILSGSSDESVRCWDAKSGTLIWVRQTQAPIIKLRDLEFTTGEPGVAALCANNSIFSWDAATGDLNYSVEVFRGTVSQFTSVLIADEAETYLCCGLADGALVFFNAKNGAEIRSCEYHSGPVRSLTAIYVPDRQPLVASGGEDRMLVLWNCVDGTILQKLSGHSAPITKICSTHGEHGQVYVASVSGDATVRVWNPLEGNLIWRSQSHQSTVTDITSVDALTGREVMVTSSLDRTLRVWDPSGKGSEMETSEKELEWVTSLCPIHCGRSKSRRPMIASGSINGTIYLYDAESGFQIRTMSTNPSPIQAICTKGKYLTAGSEDGTFSIWNLQSGKLIFSRQEHGDKIWAICTIKHKGKVLFVSGSEDRTVKFWAQDGSILADGHGHSGGVQSLCRATRYLEDSSKEDLVVSGSSDCQIIVWGGDGSKQFVLIGHSGAVHSLAFAHGHGVLASGSSDNSLRLWNIQDKTCIKEILTGSSDGLSVFNIGPKSSQCCFVTASFTSKSFSFWDAVSGSFLRKLKYPVHNLSTVSWSENGVLLIGRQDGRVSVFESKYSDISSGVSKSTPPIPFASRQPLKTPLQRAQTATSRVVPAYTIAQLRRRWTERSPSRLADPNPLQERRQYYEAHSPKPAMEAHEAVLLGLDSWQFFS